MVTEVPLIPFHNHIFLCETATWNLGVPFSFCIVLLHMYEIVYSELCMF